MSETVLPENEAQEIQNLPEHEVVVCAIGREYFALPLESPAEIFKSTEITQLPLAPLKRCTVTLPRCCRLQGSSVWRIPGKRAFC